jgi:hypothetical protein
VLKEQNVTNCVRLTYFDKEKKERQPSNTVKLYFNVPELPVRVSLGFRMYKTKLFIPRPIQCFNCQQFGHMQSDCSKPRVCFKCGQQHENKQCTVDKPKCVLFTLTLGLFAGFNWVFISTLACCGVHFSTNTFFMTNNFSIFWGQRKTALQYCQIIF